jgi:hypothetical protein
MYGSLELDGAVTLCATWLIGRYDNKDMKYSDGHVLRADFQTGLGPSSGTANSTLKVSIVLLLTTSSERLFNSRIVFENKYVLWLSVLASDARYEILLFCSHFLLLFSGLNATRLALGLFHFMCLGHIKKNWWSSPPVPDFFFFFSHLSFTF